jgi:CHAT domain-containing protein/tetratricopeptide (TPR) repeat protein
LTDVTAAATAGTADWPARARESMQGAVSERWLRTPADRLALARALKDLCYEKWNSSPQEAAQAADAVRRVQRAGPGVATDRDDLEVGALAEWTEGIACVTRGQMADAVKSFDAAAQTFRQCGLSHQAAQTQIPKVMALVMLGRHADAADCGTAAQRAFVQQKDFRAAGKISLNLGSMHLRLDEYAQGASQYRAAAVWFARAGDHEHSVLADIGLADALTCTGDFDEALRIYARARMRAARHRLAVVEAILAESVALLELARGRYAQALSGLEASRAGYESLQMPQHLAIATKQLADVYLELHLLPEARELFERALRDFDLLDMPTDRAWTLSQLGRTLALQAQVDPASEVLSQAAQAFSSHGNAVGAATVQLARAELALDAGQPDAARELAREAADVFDRADRAEFSVRAEAVLAESDRLGGDLDRSGAGFDAALSRARRLQLTTLHVRCLVGQAQVARGRGDVVAAQDLFEAAVGLFEDQRRALPGDEIRSAFLGDHLLPYRELLRLRLEAHEQGRADSAPVLREIERVRARTLSERVGQQRLADADPTSDALRTRLSWLYRRTQRMDDDAPVPPSLREELLRTESELLERVRRRRLRETVQDDTADAGLPVDVGALQARLAPSDAVVVYAALDQELLACVVTAERIVVHRRLALWSDVIASLRSVLFQIESLRHGEAPVRQHLDALTLRARQRLRHLHELVWAPLSASVAGAARVAVVPHGALGAVPFAALDDGEGVLMQRHQIALVASAGLLLHALRRPQPAVPARALALGESSRLPHAGREAEFVAGLFARGVACVGVDASLATLRERAGAADLIHLACHARFRSDNPRFSALYLADGALTAELAEQMRLPSSMVVLSGCETGQSGQIGGDEMFGLVRAFIAAGASRVVASQWPVDDAVTADFMRWFYTDLCAGVLPGAALRAAQQRMRAQRPHPCHWAAFTLHGGW